MTDLLRLPAFPLLTSDPYVSVWLCADGPTEDDTRHWTGERKRLRLSLSVDGQPFALLGLAGGEAAACTAIEVTPTQTRFTYRAAGVEATLAFRAPLLLEDWDLLSMPVTLVNLGVRALDGRLHAVAAKLTWFDDICYRGATPPAIIGDALLDGGLAVAYMGRREQNLLCHAGDLLSIDWGYAYLAGDAQLSFEPQEGCHALTAAWGATVGDAPEVMRLLMAYDDVASIQYFGHIARAWYARGDMRIMDALRYVQNAREEVEARCAALDESIMARAEAMGGPSYRMLVCAAYRQSIAAHKLIADEAGQPVFLSKENGSNGCIGTTDVSYPSIPLYLLYSPALVRAMCRPILRFAALPAWAHAYAPHDVGRYPHATGQVYGIGGAEAVRDMNARIGRDGVYPPLYQFGDAAQEVYDPAYQMPVEECGNMVLMIAAAMRADGDTAFAREHMDRLDQWVRYLIEFGGDPGQQLCTDDFAGHLARNVNLAFKAVYGVAAYAWMRGALGDTKQAAFYREMSERLAARVLAGARREGHTALTLQGGGWSLKYNTVWDRLFGFGLLGKDFFADELKQYLARQNRYGVPLDNREAYTKSDWQMWVAAMADDPAILAALAEPICRYLRETTSRFPFPDWYDTITGVHYQFINRSVQGGVFMPLLMAAWRSGDAE